MPRLALVALLVLSPSAFAAEEKRPMQVADLFRFKRVSDPQISPDGQSVVYVVGEVDMEKNRIVSHLWLAASHGSTKPRQLTQGDKSDRHPRWSPDSKSILFESGRSGTNQLWLLDLSGGEARQLTHISTGASTGTWSRDGTHIAFVSAVWPEYSEKPFKESDALNKKRMDENEKSPVKAKVFTRLFYRHWDDYVEDKRQHLFVMSLGDGTTGEPKDVTPGDRDAYPTSTTFSSSVDFTFSPDGAHLVFTAPPEKDEAWSTNYDLYRVPVTGGTTKWESLTSDNLAADSGPQFSPNGKALAYRCQHRPGFEADRWQIVVTACDESGIPQRKARLLASKWDRSIENFAWYDDGSMLLSADQEGQTPLFRLDLKPGSEPVAIVKGGTFGPPSIALTADPSGTKARVVATQAFMSQPPEVCGLIEGIPFKLSHANDAILDQLDLPRPEGVTVKGAGGDPMQMWILKPPGFDASKKWPLVYLVHGGPQGAWEDGWSWRWCPELWAAQGYVVALPNPRGSTGFGQKYIDEISGDWGGKCYEDLMAGVAYLEKQPYIDSDRMAAAGASFGGYMMNWFQGNTDKFKTLITHCGVYNFESMYALTEELWFDEWEHGGPPWGKNRTSYEKHSPHRLAKNFKTPMLIIHNDLDFRVPVSEGHQLFTTLQRLGVPSRFINFPDEGHWVLKPRNSERWHQEVFNWLRRYVPPGGK